MDEVLTLKFRQHPDLKQLLFYTYPYELVYIEPNDPLVGGDYDDDLRRNEVGKSLMRLREKLPRYEPGLYR